MGLDGDEDDLYHNWWLLSSDSHFCCPYVDQLVSFSLNRRRALVYQLDCIKSKRAIACNQYKIASSITSCADSTWTKESEEDLHREIQDLIRTGRATSLHVQRIRGFIWGNNSPISSFVSAVSSNDNNGNNNSSQLDELEFSE